MLALLLDTIGIVLTAAKRAASLDEFHLALTKRVPIEV
jgi:hypothetical protein